MYHPLFSLFNMRKLCYSNVFSFQFSIEKKMHRLLEHSATRRRIFIAHGILVSFLLMLSWKSTYLLKDNVKIWGRMKENIFMWVKCWNDVVCNKYVGPNCKSLLTSSQCFSMGECGLCLGDMLALIEVCFCYFVAETLTFITVDKPFET